MQPHSGLEQQAGCLRPQVRKSPNPGYWKRPLCHTQAGCLGLPGASNLQTQAGY